MADATTPPSDPSAPPPDDAAPPPEGGGALAVVNPLDIVDELRDSYLTYAQSVIISRALPDVRDGLKPSQRRILVAMNDLGLGPSSSTSKCAGIIGETMKRYHPHGDASIYDSLVRMAQDWNLRYRLVHGQGNFGSIAGLPPAAHRYTEARLTPAAGELLEDLERDTVDFIDNYDGKYREPLVLPGKFPNLLVNGSDGIAVGMATHIPPHNLREVCKALILLLDNPSAGLAELIQIIPGPDFPTGGIIMGRQGLLDAYARGAGKITLRARAQVMEEVKGKSPSILISEVPFQVTRNSLTEEIAALVKEERIPDISAVRDESSARNGEPVRLIVEIKRGKDPHLVLNQLYQYTKLQKTVSIIMLALVDGRPRELTLKEMLQKFLDHRVHVIRRRTEFLLREAKRRGHVLEGQLIAIADIDNVIQICRTSPNRTEAKARLQGLSVPAALMERAIGEAAFAALQRELGTVAEYRMTEQQAEAVVNLRLGQLAALESEEILKEYMQLRDLIRGYETLLSDDANIHTVIRDDLERMASKYGDDRKTEVSDDGGDVDMEDLIVDEPNVVTISHEGFVKRMPLDAYRVQARGGKGVQGGLRDNDFVEHFFVASTKAYLLCFATTGQVYWLKVYKIPTANRTSPGRAMANVLSLKEGEKIASVIPVREFAEGVSLTKATKLGLVKKTPLMDYSRPKQGGIRGIQLEDGDALVRVCLTRAGDELVLNTRQGMAIRFSEAEVRSVGRDSKGVKGLTLLPADEVIGMVVVDSGGLVLTVCENGYGKRIPFGPGVLENEDDETADGAETAETAEPEAPGGDEAAEGDEVPDRRGLRYRKQKRGGKGLRYMKTAGRNGAVVAVEAVRDGDEVILISQQGMVTRTRVDDIRVCGRYALGVRVMNLNSGDKIVSVAKVAQENVGDAGEGKE